MAEKQGGGRETFVPFKSCTMSIYYIVKKIK